MATINENIPEADASGAEVSLRDELEAAFEKEPTDEVSERQQSDDDKPEATTTPEQQRTRDQQGRFAKAQADAEAAAATGARQVQAAPGPQDSKDIKPPASWTPGAREEWSTLSPRVKQEVARREWEAQKVVQEGASARQFISAFENVVRPYEMFIRAENSNPLQAVQNLMQTAADLRVGPPAAKANLIAGLVQQYGIDVAMLDSALDKLLNGRGNGIQASPQQQFQDPRVDQLLAHQQRQIQEREQQQQAEVRTTLNKFAETHEFYNDVASTMADIIDIRTKRGEPIELEKVYQHACQMNDEVRSILSQRSSPGAQRQAGPSQAVLRAKRAASSVRGDSTHDGATIPKDDSIRASIEAALENGRM